MRTTLDDVTAALGSLEPDSAARFAAACATRLRPVLQALGSETARLAYDSAVERLWRADRRELERVLEQIESAPEADEDDSHRAGYEVMRTLSVAAYGLDLLGWSPRAESAEWVAGAAGDVAAGLDAYGGTSALQQAELADQLAQARHLAESAVDVPALRREAEVAAARVAHVLPDVARRQGWQLNDPGGP